MRKFILRMDKNSGNPTNFNSVSGTINALSLGVATEKTMTVPADAHLVRIAGSIVFYAKLNATAVMPVDTVDGTASEIGPVFWMVNPGDVIHVISAAACLVTFSFYK